MSKTDNLTDFLTDVADAIREKKGTTDKINPQNFSEEIRGIESGNVFGETMIDNTGKGIGNVKKLYFSDGVTEIGAFAYGRAGCTHVYIPDSLVKIGGSAFHTSNYLTYISPMPPTLNYIGQQAFAYTALKMLDCRRCVSIPTLGGTAAFPNGTIIVVPDTLYEEWTSDTQTNWNTLKDRIVKASEYVEPTTE